MNTNVTTATRPEKQADQKHCHSCGRLLHVSATTCPDCGATQSASNLYAVQSGVPQNSHPINNAVYCKSCGNTMHAAAENCPHCGVPTGVKHGTKSRTSAMLWALFLGGIGAHRFYLGQNFWGVAYLLLCWTFIPAILAFIEFIGFLTMSDEKFDKLYN